jgi:hypothetical protein
LSSRTIVTPVAVVPAIVSPSRLTSGAACAGTLNLTRIVVLSRGGFAASADGAATSTTTPITPSLRSMLRVYN